MRELSSLIGLQVISTSEGKKLGTVADAYVDLAAGELVCVTLSKTPELRVILAGDIDVIGDDAIMVSGEDKLQGREAVEEELERGKRVLSSPPTVVTSQGKTLGNLGVIQIDEGTGNVIRFEVTGGALKDVTEGVLALPILEGIVHGQDTLIVPHDVVARRLVQSGGLRGALRNFGERLKVSVDDISERSGEFVRESEKKLKQSAEDARKKAGEATEKARKRVSEVAEEAKEAIEHEEPEPSEEAEEPSEAPEAPDAEPDAPRVEDPEGEQEDAVQPVEEPEETHLVPEPGTPLPEGEGDEDVTEDQPSEEDEPAAGNAPEEESSEDEVSAEENAPENAAEEQSSADEGGEESDRDEA